MFSIDPASLTLTNGLVSIALSAVLLVSRMGMGAEGRGIRTWVLGDLAITMARIVAAATIAGLPLAQGLIFPVVPGCFAAMGLVAHAQALRSVAGRPAAPRWIAVQALGLSLLFCMAALQLDSLTLRVRLLDGMLMLGALVTLWLTRSLLRFWGARLIASMMVLAAITQGLRFAALLFGQDLEMPPEAEQHLRASVRPSTLVLDLVIALFVTGGFVLLMQERLRERIERLVVTDALTGALNRRGMMPLLEEGWAQAQRHGRSLSVVMFDLDHFKRINDRHGHAAGDDVLAGFAAHVGAHLRQHDKLCRWGGEEFLLLLNDTGLSGAHTLAERMRLSVAQTPMNSQALHVTVSAGVACLRGSGISDPAQSTSALLALLDSADRRLYLAKKRRNCVVSDESEPGEQPAG